MVDDKFDDEEELKFTEFSDDEIYNCAKDIEFLQKVFKERIKFMKN